MIGDDDAAAVDNGRIDGDDGDVSPAGVAPNEEGATVDKEFSVDVNEVLVVGCSKVKRSQTTRVRSATSTCERSQCKFRGQVAKQLQGELIMGVGTMHDPEPETVQPKEVGDSSQVKKPKVGDVTRVNMEKGYPKPQRKWRVASSKGERRVRFDLKAR